MPEATPEPGSIGARIRRLRLERGLSQRDLSEPGVSYAYVSRIEAGARQPSLKAIRLLAAKLGVSPEYLETGAGTPKAYDREIRLGDAEVAVRLGEALEEAEQAFRAVLEEARQTADVAAETRARVGLALALAQGGRHAEATAQLERSLASPAVTPATRPDAFVALGHSGSHLERADQLLELSAEPGDLATLRTQQAHRAVRLGEPHRAIERATEALGYLEDGTPAQGSAWHALGAAHALTGDVEAASDSLRRSVELLREGGAWREAMTAYRVWAKVLREAGRNQEAFEIIEQATLLTLRNAGSSTRRSPLRR